jgi:hypothetical protein
MQLSVGSRLWQFNRNRCVYRRDENGRPHGNPIWREHWEQVEIIGETSQSWILPWNKKIPKKQLPEGYVLDESEINRQAYIVENSSRIAQRVQAIQDPDLLMQVAKLIGYEPSCLTND